jgi:Mg2+-importing ATPase
MRFSFDAVFASTLVPARFRAPGELEKHGPDIANSVTQTKETELTARLARFARVTVSDVFE